MATTLRSPIGPSLALGIAGGLRSMTPLAALAVARRAELAPGRHAGAHDGDSPGTGLLLAMAGAEMLGDKLPGVPSRLSPPALLGRLAATAIAGAVLGARSRDAGAVLRCASIAALGGLLGAVGGYWARSALVEKAGLSGTAVALAEDAAAISISRAAILRAWPS